MSTLSHFQRDAGLLAGWLLWLLWLGWLIIDPTTSRSAPLADERLQVAAALDTYVASGQPDAHFETAPTLRVGYSEGDGRQGQRALLGFDLTAIPPGS